MLECKSLTIEYQGLADSLNSQCKISEAYSIKDKESGKPHPVAIDFRALWDTGATKSSISQKVVDALGLKPVSKGKNHTAAGIVDTYLYIVNIILPSNVGIPCLMVTCSDLGDIDVLIGMDVINKGDFAITNVKGKTTFSFRVPSIETIDFVNNPPKNAVKAQSQLRIGRNDSCPCGSGKKYKKCCGK